MSGQTLIPAASGSPLSAGFINQFLEAADAEYAYDSSGRLVAVLAGSSPNLLSLADSAFEPGLGGWTGTNASLSLNGYGLQAWFYSINSMEVTTTESGSAFSAALPSGTAATPVSPSTQYTGLAWVQTAGTPQGATVSLVWFDSTGAQISVSSGSAVNDAVGIMTEISVTATSPSNAAYAQLVVTWATSGAVGEIHYLGFACLQTGSSLTAIPGQQLLTFQYNAQSQLHVAVIYAGGSAQTFILNYSGWQLISVTG